MANPLFTNAPPQPPDPHRKGIPMDVPPEGGSPLPPTPVDFPQVPIELMLTMDEVCIILGCGETMLRKLWKKGELVPKKVGWLVRYLPQDVRDYIRSK